MKQMSLPIEIKQKIMSAMKQFNIPGLGLVIISPEYTGISKFGYANLEN